MRGLSRAAWLYVGGVTGVAATAAAVALAHSGQWPAQTWGVVLLLSGLLWLANLEPARVWRGTVHLAPTVPVFLASVIIVGPWGAILVAATDVLALSRQRFVKRVFNASQMVVLTLVSAEVYYALHGVGPLVGDGHQVIGVHDFPALLVPLGAADLAAMVTNALLMIGILRFAQGISPWSVWRMVLSTSLLPYLAYGLFGLLLAVLWQATSVFGALLVLLPLLIARWVYAQYAHQRDAYEATIRSLVQAVETKDLYTRGHSLRVQKASMMIARVIGMSEDRVTTLGYAGILHDIGKLGVPTKLLNKTGPLSDQEFAAIQMHPVLGTEMVRDISFLEEAYVGILHHHERLDGRGYPSGLTGDQIPQFARIIAVADAFDSMTSTRSYRGARTVDEAIAELQRYRGTQFDPEMVDSLIAALENEPWAPRREDVPSPFGADVPMGVQGVDHDDPTAALPLGHDPRVAAAAAAAQQAEDDALRLGGDR